MEALFEPEEWSRHAQALRRMALALLRDEARSDDAVQGACLAALEHAPRPLTLEWMRRVVQNRAFDTLRRERRRREVELGQVGEDPADEPDFTEKLELHRFLVEAVQGLSEPEKRVIYLRYFDGLSPAEIARRLDAPVKTVKTRLSRALAHLRERLRRRYGAGASGWTHAFAATFLPGARAALQITTTATVAGGVGIMAKKIALVALVLAAAWGVWTWGPLRGDAARPPGGSVAMPEVLQPVAGDAPKLEATQEASFAGRVAADPGVDATLVAPLTETRGATLDVEVLWSDRSPAAGVGVHLQRITDGLPYQGLDRKVSDSRGFARFAGVPAGTYQLNADRRDSDNALRVELAVDDEQAVRFVLVAGVDVEGVVLDRSGLPIADAGIWLTTGHGDWLGGNAIERTGADGRFRLRAVPEQQSIGALAAGYSPSQLVDLEDLDTSAPVRIELRMELVGGALRGLVTGPDGEPLAGALVSVGAVANSDYGFGGGAVVERWTPRTAETDAQGEYALHGLALGTKPLRVRAAGLPIGKTEVEIVADQTTVANVALVAGAGVAGVVSGLDGLPLANAVVRAFDADVDRTFLQSGQFDYEDVFGYPAVRTDADGRYSVAPIAPGDVHLFATPTLTAQERERGVPRAETVLNAKPGDALTWNARIGEGHVIEGIVTYRDGIPMPQVFVSARNDRTGVSQARVNDAEGRFRFLNMEMEPHVLGVQLWTKPAGAGPVEARDVYPDRGIVQLAADFDAPVETKPATVRGKIEDVGGRAARPDLLSVQLQSDRNFFRVNPDRDGLDFAFTGVEPGRYRPVVVVGEIPAYAGDWITLAPGEDCNLGTLRTERAGSLRLLVPRTPATTGVELRVYLRPPGVMMGFHVELGRDDERLVENVSAGEIELSAYSTGIAPVHASATVKAGEETRLTLVLRPAAEVPLEILWPENHALGGLTLRVENEQGQSVWDKHETNVAFLKRPYAPRPQLEVGRYTLFGESDSGLRGSTSFAVKSLAPDQPTVSLELQ
jgi:RNA polymerase sigma factor (sigma-70 family)